MTSQQPIGPLGWAYGYLSTSVPNAEPVSPKRMSIDRTNVHFDNLRLSFAKINNLSMSNREATAHDPTWPSYASRTIGLTAVDSVLDDFFFVKKNSFITFQSFKNLLWIFNYYRWLLLINVRQNNMPCSKNCHLTQMLTMRFANLYSRLPQHR